MTAAIKEAAEFPASFLETVVMTSAVYVETFSLHCAKALMCSPRS